MQPEVQYGGSAALEAAKGEAMTRGHKGHKGRHADPAKQSPWGSQESGTQNEGEPLLINLIIIAARVQINIYTRILINKQNRKPLFHRIAQLQSTIMTCSKQTVGRHEQSIQGEYNAISMHHCRLAQLQ